MKFKKILIFLLCMLVFVPSCVYAQEEITAPAYILGDKKTGTVLLKNNENEKRAIASVTKIMTLLLTFEEIEKGNLSLEEKISASANASGMGGSQIYLKEHEEMSLNDLIKSVFVASANDACVAIAERISGSTEAFVARMNEKAKELGLKNTSFKNPHGLDEEGHYSSAYDLFVISRELMKYDIQKYTTIWQDSIRNGEFVLTNTNKLIRFYPNATGLKTGSTSKAGFCISATAQKGNTEFIAVVLGGKTSKERFDDAKTLLNYGFANYKTLSLATKNEKIWECSVIYGKEKSVNVVAKENADILIKANDNEKIEKKVEINEVYAPVKKGENAGTVRFFKGGKEIGKADLLFEKNIEKKTYFDIVREFVVS